MKFKSITALFVTVLLQLCQHSSATYGGGSYFSYTSANHFNPPQYALYKSPAFSNGYQYSYLPSQIYHHQPAVVPTVPALPTLPSVYTQSVWPATTTYKTYKAPAFYSTAFTAPCAHSPVSSFQVYHTAKPVSGAPVYKTKPNNSTEHVYKPIYAPLAWGFAQPLFAYQGTIQHIPMPPKDMTGSSEMMGDDGKDAKKEETPKDEMEKEGPPTPAAKAEAEAAKAEAEGKPAAEPEVSEETKTEEPAAAEKAEPAKAKRAASIAKRFGSRKKL